MRVLITGASGQLGGYLLRELRGRNHEITAWSGLRTGDVFGISLRPVDRSHIHELSAAFGEVEPDVVLHCGGMSTVAGCYREPSMARDVNTLATERLAECCKNSGARLIFTSTDLVFDGARGRYREEAVPAPLSVYGQTKLAAEPAVLACPKGVVARLSLLFGPSLIGRPSFFDDQIAALRAGRPMTLFVDEWRTPLSLKTAAKGLIALAESDFSGLVHFGGPERLSRFDMGMKLAAFLGVDGSSNVAACRADVPSPEPRPRDVSLDSTLWRRQFPSISRPTWTEALHDLIRD